MDHHWDPKERGWERGFASLHLLMADLTKNCSSNRKVCHVLFILEEHKGKNKKSSVLFSICILPLVIKLEVAIHSSSFLVHDESTALSPFTYFIVIHDTCLSQGPLAHLQIAQKYCSSSSDKVQMSHFTCICCQRSLKFNKAFLCWWEIILNIVRWMFPVKLSTVWHCGVVRY